MYTELGKFVWSIAKTKSMWKDGELWTAVAIGIGVGIWCEYDLSALPKIRSHFSDIVSVTSITFGFILTTLIFYVQAADNWSNDLRVQRIAEKLVDWHVWTVFCLLILLGYTLLLWTIGGLDAIPHITRAALHGILAFLGAYPGCQILNHALTIRWVFRTRHRLRTDSSRRPPPERAEQGDELGPQI